MSVSPWKPGLFLPGKQFRKRIFNNPGSSGYHPNAGPLPVILRCPLGRGCAFFRCPKAQNLPADNGLMLRLKGSGHSPHRLVIFCLGRLIGRVCISADQSGNHKHGRYCAAHFPHAPHAGSKGTGKAKGCIPVQAKQIAVGSKYRLAAIIAGHKQFHRLIYSAFHDIYFTSTLQPSGPSIRPNWIPVMVS